MDAGYFYIETKAPEPEQGEACLLYTKVPTLFLVDPLYRLGASRSDYTKMIPMQPTPPFVMVFVRVRPGGKKVHHVTANALFADVFDRQPQVKALMRDARCANPFYISGLFLPGAINSECSIQGSLSELPANAYAATAVSTMSLRGIQASIQ